MKDYAEEHSVWAFGSRVHGKNLKKYSDLDLALVSNTSIDIDMLSQLKSQFSASDLPFKVDVVDFFSVSDEFKKIIEESYERIK